MSSTGCAVDYVAADSNWRGLKMTTLRLDDLGTAKKKDEIVISSISSPDKKRLPQRRRAESVDRTHDLQIACLQSDADYH